MVLTVERRYRQPIDMVASGAAPAYPAVTFTGAWSFHEVIVPGYGGVLSTTSGGKFDSLKDQTGNGRDILQATVIRQPSPGTGGARGVACGAFTSADLTNMQTTGAISNFITSSAGYIAVAFIATTIDSTTGLGSAANNETIIADGDGYIGIHAWNNGTNDQVYAYNWDGNADVATPDNVTEGTVYVMEWWHESGNIKGRLNKGTDRSAVSNNTAGMAGVLRIGLGWVTADPANALDGKIFSIVTASSVPSQADRDAIAIAMYYGVQGTLL